MIVPHPDHPYLTPENYAETSESTRRYNCLAWAAGDIVNWWEPDEMLNHFWPSWAPREFTLHAHIQAFAGLGYETCPTGALEAGFEKVALFAKGDQIKHAARQLSSGRWTSKMGFDVDIEHVDLGAVGGGRYGEVVVFLRRRRRPLADVPQGLGRGLASG